MGTSPTPARRPRGRPGRVAERVGMEIKRGIPVSSGVAIGTALVLDTEWFRIPQRHIEPEDLATELQRLRAALAAAAADVRGNQQVVTDKLGQQYGAVFGAHALMIEDPTLLREIEGQ